MFPLLNEELKAGQLNKALFVFPPIEIPITEDGIVAAEGGPAAHYASVVYDLNSNKFALLEYGRSFFHALASYKQRHGRLIDLEILLTRHPNNKLKMSIGNTDKVNILDLPSGTFEELQDGYYDKLIGYYRSLTKYKVHDL